MAVFPGRILHLPGPPDLPSGFPARECNAAHQAIALSCKGAQELWALDWRGFKEKQCWAREAELELPFPLPRV